MSNILRQVTLNKANRLKDRSVSLNFVTDLEQDSEDFMEIDKAINQHGMIYFKPGGNLTTEELEELNKVDIEMVGKTKNERLRNVIWVYCDQNNLDFDDVYDKEKEDRIQFYKNKLT